MGDIIPFSKKPLEEDKQVWSSADMTGAAVVNRNRDIDHEQLKVRVTFKLILLTTLAVIGGFLFGYDTGVISGANLYLRVQFSLDTLTEELIVSVTVGVAAIFSLVGGVTNEYLGRKITILASSILFIIGSVVLAASEWYWMLMVGRVIVGIAIGLSSMTIPMYIAETAPPNVRGIMITMFQLLITFGLFMASVMDAAFSYITDSNINWRLMLAFPAIFALLQFIGFLFMPESPRYLVAVGKEEKARQVIFDISGRDETAKKVAETEVHDIRVTCDEADEVRNSPGNKGKTILQIMVKQATIRKALIIGCLLQMFQQLCGINTVMYYSATIIQMGGISSKTLAIWMAAVTSGVNFLCTFIGIYLVDRIGRRKLLLGSILGVVLCLALLGISFAVISSNSPNAYYDENSPLRQNDSCANIQSCDACSYMSNCGFCFDDPNNESYSGSCVAVYDDSNNKLTVSPNQWANYGRCAPANMSNPVNQPFQESNAQWDYGFCPTSFSWLPILGMVLYLCSFSAGFGPVPWTVCAEIFPNWARSTGVAITTASNWLFNLVISLTFLSLANAITRQGAYFLYAGITLVGLVFCYFVIPETKDKKIEEIDEIMQGPWFHRGKNRVQPEKSYGTISGIGEHKPVTNVRQTAVQNSPYENAPTLDEKI